MSKVDGSGGVGILELARTGSETLEGGALIESHPPDTGVVSGRASADTDLADSSTASDRTSSKSQVPDVSRKMAPLIQIPVPGRSPRYLPEKAWLGLVLEMTDAGFRARLLDQDGGAPLLGDFDFEEVADEDHDLVHVGAEFYWNIGYRDSVSGQRERASLLRFRRLPRIEKRLLDKARAEAEALLSDLQEE